jgi:hypothetical protein
MSKEGDRPTGQRFSHVYLKRGQPSPDSVRLRRRIAAYYVDNIDADEHYDCVRLIRRELRISGNFEYKTGTEALIVSCELRDLLDAITLISRSIAKRQGDYVHEYRERKAKQWAEFVERTFREENVAYTVDDLGGVHYFVDAEFQRNRVAALQCLGSSPYGAALAAFEAAYAALDEVPPDTARAVRSIFEALETVAKLVDESGNVKRLGETEVDKTLRSLCLSRYAASSTERNTASIFLTSMAKWVSALQSYRHAQKVDQPNPPPLELTVALLSSGAAYVRFLVEVAGKPPVS